jgi:hypothetical protein
MSTPTNTPPPASTGHPILNPQPKTRFQGINGAIAGHKAMLDRSSFDMGTDYAMLQFCARLTGMVADCNTAMAAGFMLRGAQEYLSTLKLLAETPQPIAVLPDGNLNHRS